jgi:DMSO/TMAO reductase YedYZ molybdopterin-dependent catalytic subunit
MNFNFLQALPMRKIYFLLALVLGAGSALAQKAGPMPPYFSDTVFVRGSIGKPMVLTVGNLHGLKLHHPGKHNVTCESGEVKKKIDGFEGVLLKDIVEAAGVTMASKKEQGKYIVVVTATDGYTATFAYDEIMYGPAGDAAYLLVSEGGKPIDRDGPFVVLCTSDKASGPRHVKWVRDIEIRKI